MKQFLIIAAIGVYSAAALAEGDHGGHHPATAQSGADQGQTSASTSASAEMTDGEVRKVDKSTNKITLKHGELKGLGMPPMTMVFQVKDPAMLDQVKPGDKVRFSADRVNGAITVTAIEPAR